MLVRLFSLAIGLRVTVVLLLVVVAATALGAFLPAGDALLGSWWYSLLLGLVAAQTALCTVSRGRTALVQALTPRRFAGGDTERVSVGGDLRAVVVEARRLGFRRVGGSSLPDPSGELPAVMVKGRLQPLGFVVLHVGLIVFLGGAVWNLQGSTSRTFAPAPGVRELDRESGRQLEVVAVRPEARPVGEGEGRRWELTSLEADVRLYEGAVLRTEGTVALGSPLDVGGAELVLLPALERYQVALRVETPEGRRVQALVTSEDPLVPLPGSGVAVRVEDFAPDVVSTAGGRWTRDGPLLRAPVAAVALVDRETGAPRAAADLRPGETLEHGGYGVSFVEARYVPQVVLSRQAGRLLVLVGAFALMVGTILSTAFSFRQLRLRPTEGGVEVRGYARRRHQPIAEELAALAGAVGGGSDGASCGRPTATAGAAAEPPDEGAAKGDDPAGGSRRKALR